MRSRFSWKRPGPRRTWSSRNGRIGEFPPGPGSEGIISVLEFGRAVAWRRRVVDRALLSHDMLDSDDPSWNELHVFLDYQLQCRLTAVSMDRPLYTKTTSNDSPYASPLMWGIPLS